MVRKLTYICLAGLVLSGLTGCHSKDLEPKLDYLLTLDSSNTYLAGEPVVFNLEGEVDNILFFSGEEGEQYDLRYRTQVPVDQVEGATLTLNLQGSYGFGGGLDIYVTTGFPGLLGNDGEADRATIKELETKMDQDGNIEGWTKLEFNDLNTSATGWNWELHDYDLSGHIENMCLAFHWHPRWTNNNAQRTYRVKGSLKVILPDAEDTEMDLSNLEFTPITMNECFEPYRVNEKTDPSIKFNDSSAPLLFKGCTATAMDEGIDAWVFTTPMTLNIGEPDKGTVLKNLQNGLRSFSHTYDTPGTYKATAICSSYSFLGSKTDTKKFVINILEK